MINTWLYLICTVVFSWWLYTTTAMANEYGEYSMPSTGDDVIGQIYTVTIKKGDSLTTIRRKHDVSQEELVEANPNINFNKLKVGQKIIIPKQFILPKIRHGIVINVPELRLYYFAPDGTHVHTFPVGLGRPNWRTPLASTKIVSKEADPVWHVPKSIHDYVLNKTGEVLPDVVLPGPKNPLGKYALHLRKEGYLIHGTNAPNSVGTFVSSGCMRLLQEPIEVLYREVQVGAPVYIIHIPSKAGWRNNKLYLESHKPVDSYYQIDSSLNIDAESVIYEAIHLDHAEINWDAVSKNITEHTGIPEVVGYRIDITN